MIIVCTHKSPDTLEQFLGSIRKYSKENHKILCVETSESQISKPIAEKYDALFENTELKYEIGAFNYATNTYPDEPEYFMFQDSIEIIAEDWEHMMRSPSGGVKMVALCGYRLVDDPCPGCGEDVFYNLYGKAWPLHQAYGVMTNSFYVPKMGKDKLKEFGIDLLVSENKNDTFGTERVLGAIGHYACGFETTNSAVGEWIWDDSHFRSNTGFTKYILKHILSRQ
jgi:hypothetical protein